jgi:hypothetical protein
MPLLTIESIQPQFGILGPVSAVTESEYRSSLSGPARGARRLSIEIVNVVNRR